MNLVKAILPSDVRWIVPLDLPDTIKIGRGGVSLVSPLCEESTSPNVLLLDDGHLLVTRQSISLAFERWPEELSSSDEPCFDASFAKVLITGLLTELRISSGQALLPRTIAALELREVDTLVRLAPPLVSKAAILNYLVQTAITAEHIQEALACMSRPQPTYKWTVLDAIKSFLDGDYEQSLLYSAISMESAAAFWLKAVANEAVNHDKYKDRFRVVDGPQSGKVDPVFKFLFKQGRFRTYLHETALYVYRRSLRLENAKLYQRAVELYGHRNVLAHQGSKGDIVAGLTGYRDTAANALITAKGVIEWFSLNSWPPLPFAKMMLIGPGWSAEDRTREEKHATIM